MNCGTTEQLSFDSAQANPPRPADLAGLLCAHGEAARFGGAGAARITVPIVESWRASALLTEFRLRGVDARRVIDSDGKSLLRTAFRSDLGPIAGQWLTGAAKAVPAGLRPSGALLRLWVLLGGAYSRTYSPGGFLLAVDPEAEHTHQPLLAALRRIGLGATLSEISRGEPALRVTGKRRLTRLAELIGEPPPLTECPWPG